MNQSLQSRRGGLLTVSGSLVLGSRFHLRTLVGLDSMVLVGMVRSHIHIPQAVSSVVAPTGRIGSVGALLLLCSASAIHLLLEQERRRFPLG